ncbi:MAG: hypothetical protein AB1777_01735 [Bacteroidota bacterium]
MDKSIKKIRFALIVLLILTSCGKQLAPSPVPATPGRSKWQVKREEVRRAWIAYWHNRKTERITRRAKAKSVKREREAAKAEKKLVDRHVKNQPAEVQERMKASQKEAEKNRPKRNLRQRLRFWKYK